MELHMKLTKRLGSSLIAVLLVGSANPSFAETEKSSAGLPLHDLIEAVAKRESKRFIVDPRVRADVVLFGQDPGKVSYDDLLSILQLFNFTATPLGKYIAITPDANARQFAMPAPSASISPSQYVTKVIHVKSVPSANLVPTLRPLIPQQGHLGYVPCTNKLIIVDTYANVERIERIVRELEIDEEYKPEKCGTSDEG